MAGSWPNPKESRVNRKQNQIFAENKPPCLLDVKIVPMRLCVERNGNAREPLSPQF